MHGSNRPRRVTAALVLAGIGSLCFLGAVALYEEPQSFYTNFVLFPTLFLIALGGLVNLVAIVLALPGLRSEGRKPALLALGIAVLIPILSIAIIQLIRLY